MNTNEINLASFLDEFTKVLYAVSVTKSLVSSDEASDFLDNFFDLYDWLPDDLREKCKEYVTSDNVDYSSSYLIYLAGKAFENHFAE